MGVWVMTTVDDQKTNFTLESGTWLHAQIGRADKKPALGKKEISSRRWVYFECSWDNFVAKMADKRPVDFKTVDFEKEAFTRTEMDASVETVMKGDYSIRPLTTVDIKGK